MPEPSDYMRMALAEADEAARSGNAPYGAVLVDPTGDVAIRERNRTVELSDPTAHAEVMAVRALCAARRTLVLEGTTMFASAHPCPMCFGAILEARVEALVYAAPAPASLWPPGSEAELAARYGRTLRVESGVLVDEAVEQLRAWGR